MKYLNKALEEELKSGKKNLYRYISSKRLFEMLSENKIAFIKPKIWQDKRDVFEGYLLKRCISDLDFNQWHQYSGISDNIYCLCCTIDKEKDLLWQSYTQNKDGVRIKFNILEIESFLNDLYLLEKVHYRPNNNIKEILRKYRDENAPSEKKLLDLFFIKRRAFKLDKEVRILTNTTTPDSHQSIWVYH